MCHELWLVDVGIAQSLCLHTTWDSRGEHHCCLHFPSLLPSPLLNSSRDKKGMSSSNTLDLPLEVTVLDSGRHSLVYT